jgi:hypothetical protein
MAGGLIRRGDPAVLFSDQWCSRYGADFLAVQNLSGCLIEFGMT